MPTLALVVFTGLTGAWLARAEGVRVLFQFQKEMATGKLPGQALLDGISVLIGGAFLLTPGVLTDVAGFSLLLPFTRRWLQRRVRARLEQQIKDGSVRVVTMGVDGFTGAAGFGASGFGGVPVDEAGRPESGPRMDPSKGIVIDYDENSMGTTPRTDVHWRLTLFFNYE